MKAKVRVDGQVVTIECNKAAAYTEGDFAGNVDLSLVTEPRLDTASLVTHLRLSLEDGSAKTDVLGSHDGPTATALTFHLPELLQASELPSAVRLHWEAGTSNLLGKITLLRAG